MTCRFLKTGRKGKKKQTDQEGGGNGKDLFGQRDDLGQEVDAEAQRVAAAADARALRVDGEDAARHAQVALLHLARPILEDLLRVQLQPEAVAVRLQLLTLNVVLPSFA